MFYIYAKAPSTSAQELTKLLEGVRVRRFDGFDFYSGKEIINFKPEDVLICWGSHVNDLDDIRVLNHSRKPTRYQDLRYLVNNSISCIRASELKDTNYNIGRLNNAHDGQDLIQPPVKPDFYVRKESFKAIYRVHSFAGKSIRAGIKEVRVGFEHNPGQLWEPGKGLAHPWIWTYDLGWKVRYEGFQSDKAVRMLAHKALRALGLTFGVVDIGMCVNTDATVVYKVIDVNRFPHVEGETLNLYVKHIKKWAIGPPEALKAAVSDDEGTEEFYVPPSAAEPPPPSMPRRTVVRSQPGLNSTRRTTIRRATLNDTLNDDFTFSRYLAEQWNFGGPNGAPQAVAQMPNVVPAPNAPIYSLDVETGPQYVPPPPPEPQYVGHPWNPFDGDDDAED